MANYNLTDILSRLSEILNDGYFVSDISINFEDEDDENMSFYTPEYEYEPVYSLGNAQSSIPIGSDTPCCVVSMSELATIVHAFSNALEYIKEQSKDKSYDAATRNEMKSASIDMRNLIVKYERILRLFC